ncbi:MAG: PD40 domain-containing protein [Bacteroidales bacterium]|nr:PD40 domain-containing protein [Bacteroidales bacterium]
MLAVCASIIFNFQCSIFNCASAQYRVVHLGKPYNTAGSETGALRVGDTVLSFSAMPPATNKGGSFHFNTSVMQLYQARIARNGKVARPKPNRWGLNSKKEHTGNLTVDPLTHDLYFTRGDLETLRCDLWYAKKQKRGWQKPVRLRGALDDRRYTYTHPAASRLPDSTLLLYFVSDREGGMGGKDIWYSIVHDGVADEPVNLGPQVNSPDDDITPFYDQTNGILYFSSDRTGGKGGFDIYCAIGQRNSWHKAEPVCGCLNSEQNDLYFTVTDHDSLGGFPVAGYLSSNRADSYFLNDSMCCNDLYRWEMDSSKFLLVHDEYADTPQDTATHKSKIINLKFPLFLYFHNDDPDPHSRDSVTAADYADCQLRYALLRSTYMAHQPTALDSMQMQRFFDSCVVGNFERVNQVLDYVEEALDDGRRVVITVSGYASPLFTDDYNRLLSARRIGSFVNMVRAWRKGLFADALDDGRLTIVQQPMGAEKVSPLTSNLSPSKDPIYGLPAARARRIEILSCEIF